MSIISKMKLPSIQLFLLYANLVIAQIELPNIFSNNMVLQQESKSAIWGSASAGLPIKIRTNWDTKKYSTITNAEGQWIIKLKTPKAGGPYTIFINDTTIKNVLIGEVWLCSGQSNMRFMLKHAASESEELPKSLQPNLRLFNMTGNPYPDNRVFHEDDLNKCQPRNYYDKTSWQECTPLSAADFSAVAYFFGKMLSQKLNVPIGLIHNAIGGSPTESWISRRSLESDTTLRKILDNWHSNDMNFMLCNYVGGCRQVAKEENMEFVDHFQYWSMREASGQNLDDWLTDGVHPNPKGQKIMAELILPILMKTVKNISTVKE